MNQLKVTLTGTAPLLMHGSLLSNPLHPATKAHKLLTSKRKKTDEDHEAIAKSEWTASMYMDKELGPYIPAINIEATMVKAAAMQRLGPKFKCGVMVLEDKCPLQYKGPRDFKGLWEDNSFVDIRDVKVQQAKIMRCRPRFDSWAVSFTLGYNPDILDQRDIQKALEDGGIMIGLCDGRPRFGKFSVEVK